MTGSLANGPDAASPGEPDGVLTAELAALWDRVRAAAGGETSAVLGDDALEFAEQVVRRSTTADAGTPVEVVHAVAALRAVRFLVGQDEADRLMAIRLLTELVPVSPELAPERWLASVGATVLDGRALLAADALERALVSSGPDVLQDAVEQLEAVVAQTPEDAADLAGRLSNLGIALRLRAERFGSDADLDRAVTVAATSVAAVVAEAGAELAGCLANLADALVTRYERRGVGRDLDEATAVLVRARAMVHGPAALVATCESKLCAVAWLRFALSGLAADLDTAVEHGRRACGCAQLMPGELASARSNLGSALATRFTMTGSARDIDEAVGVLRAAVASTAPDDPAGALRRSNLSAALQDRYRAYGAARDLDAAAFSAQSALAGALRAAHPASETATYFTNLSNILRMRGDLRARLADSADDARADLDGAVVAARRALDATPVGHPDRAGRLCNTALALQSRVSQGLAGDDPGDGRPPDVPTAGEDGAVSTVTRGSDGYLGAAVDLMRQAVAAATDPTRRSGYLANLSQLLRDRHDRDGDPADLAEAIDAAAAAARPGGDGERVLAAGVLLNLGMAHAVRWAATRQEADLTAALAALRRGAAADLAHVDDRLGCARQWGELAAVAGDWPLALAGYQAATALLAPAAWPGLARTDRELALFRQSPVASEAAAAAVHAGDPATAVELLEQGRAVLWGQLAAGLDEVGRLRRQAPDLADRLDEVRAALSLNEFGALSLSPAGSGDGERRGPGSEGS
ncbi:hypothetical protein ND748_04985 [Frankia sp. AiPs1]|uniref:hypothetical protein n=1 Tax=Frankia sp. AiPs1 TaxID=573493 RepID=UPI002043005B|nr:hypothetical protein [Frankia sp. AiPs1]MCM3921032.1 hypothetical protein [Frankia sp. AiPs1]